MCFVSPYFYCARLTDHQRELTSRVMVFDVYYFEDGSALTVPNCT